MLHILQFIEYLSIDLTYGVIVMVNIKPSVNVFLNKITVSMLNRRVPNNMFHNVNWSKYGMGMSLTKTSIT